MISNMCTRCNKLAKRKEMDGHDHARGFGCRKGEPIPAVIEVTTLPAPKTKVVKKVDVDTYVVNTGSINSMLDALLRAGVVKLQANA